MDDATAEVGSLAPRCPWCSGVLDPPGVAACPSCGATLTSQTEPQIPGLTTVAPPSVRPVRPHQRSRLLQWLSGEPAEEAAAPVPRDSLAPPPDEVRREIRRLELEAQLRNAAAEASALAAQEALEVRAGDDAAAAEPALDAVRGLPADAGIVSEAPADAPRVED
ncbi:MAG: hypothetical protein ACOYXS_02285 [Chloroflexota bacterium]